jgi:hypothetical protein
MRIDVRSYDLRQKFWYSEAKAFLSHPKKFGRSPNDISAKASNDGTDVAVSILCAISEFGVMDISPTKTRDVFPLYEDEE